MSAQPAMKCRCCGHSWTSRGGYRVVAGWHFDCWDEHHSDPTTEWPVGHVCKEER